MKLDCLILAAGNASRFGDCKLLADWNGKPLLAHSIAAARALDPASIFIVGGAFHPQLERALPGLDVSAKKNTGCAIRLLEFRAWNLGLGHSLAFGIRQLQNDNPVLVLLGDQPFINGQDLQHMYRAWCANPEKIACASFANTLGVPAIFPALLKARLYECRGDRGAKYLLQRCADQVTPVAMPSAEFDIDTQADFSEYRKKII